MRVGQGHQLHLCSSTSYHLVSFQTTLAATPNYPGAPTSTFLPRTPVRFASPSNMATFSSTSSHTLVSNIMFHKFIPVLLLMMSHIGCQFLSQFLGAGSRLLRVFMCRASRDEQEQPACDFRMSLMIKSNYTNVSTVNIEPQTLRNHEKNT